MKRSGLLDRRGGGVLMHVTSLPGPHGNGDLGGEAYRFADFLAGAGQRWWQMLPTTPVDFTGSPYLSRSAFAGSALHVGLEPLVQEGLLRRGELAAPAALGRGGVSYAAASRYRNRRLWLAYRRFADRGGPRSAEMEAFRARQHEWLEDYATFCAVSERQPCVPWTQWETPLRRRRPAALRRARRDLATEIGFHEFVQYQYDRQWAALRDYCRERRIFLMGDVPIFISHDSADVWANQGLFELDRRGSPTVVAGVPPDYFSETGQRWGNPLYRWDVIAADGYRWWVSRLRAAMARFDAVRLDHFIGFCRYWEIDASAPTALEGRYRRGPGARLFREVRRRVKGLQLVAEDLGVVTDEVRALRDGLGIPGMRVLQFAFGEGTDGEEFRPHSYPRNCVAYTGTHDNNTTVGWFRESGRLRGAGGRARRAECERALRYLGSDGREVHWDMIRAVWMSVANLAIAPMQDFLGLGATARMNVPGTSTGNWRWRLAGDALTEALRDRLASLSETYGRS